jgi:hypothetical protein
VALVNVTTALSGACPVSASIVDLIGYGATANCHEGTANAPAPSTTTADVRVSVDTDQNSTDFMAATPNPHNSLSSTAAEVSLSGRVLTANGQGIRNATVTLLGGDLNEPVTVRTGTFGYYQFDGLHAGMTYIVTVTTKRFVIGDPSRAVTALDNLADVDFIASPLE